MHLSKLNRIADYIDTIGKYSRSSNAVGVYAHFYTSHDRKSDCYNLEKKNSNIFRKKNDSCRYLGCYILIQRRVVFAILGYVSISIVLVLLFSKCD